VSVAETGTTGSRPGELHRRRVVLLAESAALVGVLSHLLGPADRLCRLGSLRELAEGRSLDSADVVVLDVPADHRAAALAQVRQRYLGPLVALVALGDDPAGLRPDDACALLARPFSTEELATALALPSRLPGASAPPRRPPPIWMTAGPGVAPVPPPGPGAPAPYPKAAAPRAPSWWTRHATGTGVKDGRWDSVLGTVAALTHIWQARRRVRVAGFSVVALLAFAVAFALAAEEGRCGPGCDALGTGFSPAPTIAPAESSAPSTRPKRATSSTAAAAATAVTAGTAGPPAGSGAFKAAASGGTAATTTTTSERRATTTTRKASSGGGGTGPTTPTTRPPTTQPSTTEPSTTEPSTTPPTTAEATPPLPGP
jgi:hypothetical protein